MFSAEFCLILEDGPAIVAERSLSACRSVRSVSVCSTHPFSRRDNTERVCGLISVRKKRAGILVAGSCFVSFPTCLCSLVVLSLASCALKHVVPSRVSLLRLSWSRQLAKEMRQLRLSHHNKWTGLCSGGAMSPSAPDIWFHFICYPCLGTRSNTPEATLGCLERATLTGNHRCVFCCSSAVARRTACSCDRYAQCMVYTCDWFERTALFTHLWLGSPKHVYEV